MINIFLVLPALILVTIVFLIPMIRYGWISFHSFSVSTNLELVPKVFFLINVISLKAQSAFI